MATSGHVNITKGTTYVAVATTGDVLTGGVPHTMEFLIGGDPDAGGTPAVTKRGHILNARDVYSATLVTGEWLYMRCTGSNVGEVPVTADAPLNQV